MKSECPLCHKDIYITPGQRVFGCGDCRKDIRKHNRDVAKYEKRTHKTAKVD